MHPVTARPYRSNKLQKTAGTAAAVRGEWQIRTPYMQYVTVGSVSFLTTERGFFDGSCLFFESQRNGNAAAPLGIDGYSVRMAYCHSTSRKQEICLFSGGICELIDRPVEMGLIEFLVLRRQAFRLVRSSIYPDFDHELVSDYQKSAKQNCGVFLPARFKNICSCSTSLTIFTAVWNTDSTATRPTATTSAVRYDRCRRYLRHIARTFLHEYFHAWNVKSIKPAAVRPYDLDKSYTEQLWAFRESVHPITTICFWHATAPSRPNLI